MALTTYSGLIDAIQDYLVGHAISNETAATFVALAEAEFNRTLRLRRMMKRIYASIAEGETSVSVPSDWLEVVGINLDGRTLHAVSLDQAEYQEDVVGGTTPQFYAVSNGEIAIIPAPSADDVVEMTYYSAIPALSEETTENWVLTAHPDLYLNAALAHAAAYVVEPRGAIWRAEADRIKEELRAESVAARYGSPLVARSRVRF